MLSFTSYYCWLVLFYNIRDLTVKFTNSRHDKWQNHMQIAHYFIDIIMLTLCKKCWMWLKTTWPAPHGSLLCHAPVRTALCIREHTFSLPKDKRNTEKGTFWYWQCWRLTMCWHWCIVSQRDYTERRLQGHIARGYVKICCEFVAFIVRLCMFQFSQVPNVRFLNKNTHTQLYHYT